MKLNSVLGLFRVGVVCFWAWGRGVADAGVAAKPAAAEAVAPAAAPALGAEGREATGAGAEPGAGAVIVVPRGPWGQGASLEVRFPAPMVAAALVGQARDVAEVLELRPPLPGRFRWSSLRSGVVELEGPLPLGQTWLVALKGGLEDAAGRPVAAVPVSVSGPGLELREHWPQSSYRGQHPQRQPEITLFFNDEVDPAQVAVAGGFTNAAGQRIQVSARRPLFKEVEKHAVAVGTWAEQGDAARVIPGEAAAISVVVVAPVAPLPTGEKWAFRLPAGLANARAQARLQQAVDLPYGDIVPLAAVGLQAGAVLDGPREWHLSFNKPLAALSPEEWARRVRLEPLPVDVRWEASGQTLRAKGSFQLGTRYVVRVPKGLAAADGTLLEAPFVGEVRFAAHAPQLTLPAFDVAQWIGGKGEFSFSSANLQAVRIKIKRAQPETVAFLLNGYATYERDEANEGAGHTRLPWAVVPGEVVWQRTLPTAVDLDRSERFGFKWDEVLGATRRPGIYFVSVEGDPKEAVSSQAVLGAQAVVQLSDIGLAWKLAGGQALVYAFSHTTGAPLAAVALRSYSEESVLRDAAVTGPDGLAKLPWGQARWLVAQVGEDLRGVPLNGGEMELDRWAFDLPAEEDAAAAPTRELLMFSERPVYQPGETVFFKAIARMRQASALRFPDQRRAQLSMIDPQGRSLFTREIEFTEKGSFAEALQLPAQGVGWHRLRIQFPRPGAAPAAPSEAGEADGEADGEEEAAEAGGLSRAVFEHRLLVQEYQPNAFRLAFDDAGVVAGVESLQVPLQASYLMGKALGSAPLTWSARLSQAAFQPSGFEGYRFCHAKSSYVFDGQNYQSIGEEAALSPLLTGQGTAKLNAQGQALLEAKLPASFGVPGPKRVTLSAEVTDINQQTIAGEWQRTEHSSAFYLGVRLPVNAAKVGSAVPLSLVAVHQGGQRWAAAVPTQVHIDRLAWNAVRVQTAGGGTEVRNEVSIIPAGDETLTVSPVLGEEEAWTFHPREVGTHHLTFTAADAAGRPVRTVVSIDVYGADWSAWERESGVKMELLPDKSEYQPGETARLVVKSPFSGMALVTVERDSVLQATLQRVEAGGSVAVAVEEAWAPNVFVSVMQVRGGAEDRRVHPQPDYRVGYAELKVASKPNQLMVELRPSLPEVRPRGLVEVSAVVRDAQGKPVPEAELALWAVDEGILSLMPWEVPDAYGYFNRDGLLGVRTGVSLQRLLPEDPEKRAFTNKGFVIGGGGEDEGAAPLMRRDFKPTAYWQGMLRTGADGSVKVTFAAPDNLTEFRLAAVASEGTSRFGRAEGRFKVNQPLMLEPALPRFANVGDEVTLKAVLHNTTNQEGEIAVELLGDEHLLLLDPVSRQPLEGRRLRRSLNLGAQQSKELAFPVKFTADGPLTLQWKASCIGAPLLADAVESKFAVGLAEPLLREIQFKTLTSADNGTNLLAAVRPELLEGTHGKITVTLSNSRLLEGAQAVNQLLHYPYGCVEQTMSAMMPWLTLRDLKKAVPDLIRPDQEIAEVIQRGSDRLLSMQTDSGGLAYWPGGKEPLLWASAHGAVGLGLAVRSGAQVPPERLASLAKWLSAALRGGSGEAWALTEQAYAAYALAVLGKAEPGYHEALFATLGSLLPTGRALLALAIMESGGPPEMARKALAFAKPEEGEDWWGAASTQAIRIMAMFTLKDPAADAAVGRLLASRSPRGDWRNTFSNAWVLRVLAQEAAEAPAWAGSGPAVLSLGETSQEINLPGTPASQEVALDFAAGAALPVLSASLPRGQRLFAKMEIASRARPGLQSARHAGFGIARSWQKVAPDGSLSEAVSLRVGDLVRVSLKLDLPTAGEFLAVDDPLPATLEAVNTHFSSMAAGLNGDAAEPAWEADHTEIRRDRVLFFRDSFGGKGSYRLSYLARVIAEGKVAVPAARAELMYDPSVFGLSASHMLTTEAAPEDGVAGR